MYRIIFYKKSNGQMPVKILIEDLRNKKDKNSRIVLKKIMDILNKLSECGLYVGMPYIRHIEDNIWEIRAFRYRIMFLVYNDSFVLLHYFLKKTEKTPDCEKKQARREAYNFIKGDNNDEKSI